MKIELEYSQGEKKVRKVIGEATNKRDAWMIIKGFLDDHNYKSYYQRIEPHPDERYVWMDVGSWSEAFYLTDMTDKELEEWKV